MSDRTFEGTCSTCGGRVVGNTITWRHAALPGRPETNPQRSWTRHYAHPSGMLVEITK